MAHSLIEETLSGERRQVQQLQTATSLIEFNPRLSLTLLVWFLHPMQKQQAATSLIEFSSFSDTFSVMYGPQCSRHATVNGSEFQSAAAAGLSDKTESLYLPPLTSSANQSLRVFVVCVPVVEHRKSSLLWDPMAVKVSLSWSRSEFRTWSAAKEKSKRSLLWVKVSLSWGRSEFRMWNTRAGNVSLSWSRSEFRMSLCLLWKLIGILSLRLWLSFGSFKLL